MHFCLLVLRKPKEMKRHQIITTLFLAILIFSCKENPERGNSMTSTQGQESEVNLKEMESDFMKWWTYHYYNISLSSNFSGLDEKSVVIDKKRFLEKLTTGDFIAIKVKSDGEFVQYKLHRLDITAEESIKSTIKSESLTKLKHFKMEGKDFPGFDFTDLNGRRYTNQSARGKTFFVKTWFVNCTACIKEFPELNEFVEKYEDRDDLVFVSLALDSKAELAELLKKRMFKYEVVSDQTNFIYDSLKLQIFPSHLIVDENGVIINVTNRASEIISFFENQEKLTENVLPPPPPSM